MGNSLIFIEVFIVYQTAKQTGMISIFLLLPLLFSFLKRRKEDSIKRNKKKKETRIETLSLSLPLPRVSKEFFNFIATVRAGNEQMGAWKVRVPTGGNKSSVVNKLTRCLSDLCSPTPPLRPVNCYTHIRVYGRRKRVL